MINKSKIFRIIVLNLSVAGFVLINGYLAEADAQRDPFSKPGWARTRETRTGGGGVAGTGVKKGPAPVIGSSVPAIEQRIEFYKRVREDAAAGGRPLPKVTSVLTLDEMSVIGIFRTPRGFAAMVEATPIKLSYTIYPGEKFFDGQLVAVEENRLVFRRVTKMSNGKFIASVENKALRRYTDREVVQGTAPTQTEGKPPETIATYQPPAADTSTKKTDSTPIVSPLDEMNKQSPAEPVKEKSKKASKKPPVKVARNK